jgi:hypothetical protein
MVFLRWQLVYVILPQAEKNFYNKDTRLQSEKLTQQADFFANIKSLIHCLSVKPEIFSVSAHAAQYFLYLRRPPKSMGRSFQQTQKSIQLWLKS